MKGFIAFLRKQGVVGFATGFIVGSSLTKLVSAFVNDFINPLLGLALGAVKGFTTITLNIGTAQLQVGHFFTTFLDFLIVAFVVYMMVHVLKFDRLDKKEDQKK